MSRKRRKRRYTAAVDDERCHADIYFHGEGGRCTRRKVVGNMCLQHAKIFDFWCDGCGTGSDESPPEHTQDCPLRHDIRRNA